MDRSLPGAVPGALTGLRGRVHSVQWQAGTESGSGWEVHLPAGMNFPGAGNI